MLMVRCPWGSRSIARTRCFASASAPPRFTAVVVLPTPPFWFAMARTRVTGGPWWGGRGSNRCAPPSRYHTRAAATTKGISRFGGDRRRVRGVHTLDGLHRHCRAHASDRDGVPLLVMEAERVKPRAVFVDEAVQLALDSRWADAVGVN